MGGHVIKLGPNNDAAAREALAAWTGGLQVGGGISVKNAQEWLEAGASKVIVTSALFPGGKFDEGVLREMCEVVGRDRLVVDIRWVRHWRLGQLGSCANPGPQLPLTENTASGLWPLVFLPSTANTSSSCRKREAGWIVAMNGWKTLTDLAVTAESVKLIEGYCSELLIHAADVEGLCQGIDEELVEREYGAVSTPTARHTHLLTHTPGLGEWVSIPCTYAGGAKDIGDLPLVDRLSHGKVDLTFGSSLDIFGGSGVKFDELVEVDARAKADSAAAA